MRRCSWEAYAVASCLGLPARSGQPRTCAEIAAVGRPSRAFQITKGIETSNGLPKTWGWVLKLSETPVKAAHGMTARLQWHLNDSPKSTELLEMLCDVSLVGLTSES